MLTSLISLTVITISFANALQYKKLPLSRHPRGLLKTHVHGHISYLVSALEMETMPCPSR